MDNVGFGIHLDDEDSLVIPNEAQLWTLSDAEVLQVLRNARVVRKAREGLRQKVLTRDNHRCRYCGCRTYAEAKIDYVVPLTQGGKTDFDNLVSACDRCHAEKSGRTLEQAKMSLLEITPA